MLYACDPDWWEVYQGAREFAGERWTQDEEAAQTWGLHYAPSANEAGLCLDGSCIHRGGNGGYQAINLAVAFGAARILLLGYDMRLGDDGRRHWHGNHPGGLHKASRYEEWVPRFASMLPDLERAGAEVLNCTPGSALACFPMASLDEALDPR